MQSLVYPAVLLPERFRAGCAFGATRAIRVVSPAGEYVEGGTISQRPRPAKPHAISKNAAAQPAFSLSRAGRKRESAKAGYRTGRDRVSRKEWIARDWNRAPSSKHPAGRSNPTDGR